MTNNKRIFAGIYILITTMVISIIIASSLCFADQKNLINNSGFEDNPVGTGIPFWSQWAWVSQEGTSVFSLDSSESHSGVKSARIENKSANDARYIQTLKCEPNTYYKLACWVKTENVGTEKKGANISVNKSTYISRDVVGTSSIWEYVELNVKTSETQKSLEVTIGLGGYGSTNTGIAWFDSVDVQQLSSLATDETAVDLGKAVLDRNVSATDRLIKSILACSAVFTLTGVALVFPYRKGKRKLAVSKSIEESAELIYTVEDSNSGLQTTESNDNPKMTRKDFWIISIMTFLYLVVALFHLGSTKFPTTSWTPEVTGESFIVNFEDNVSLHKVLFCCGLGDSSAISGKYRIEYADRSQRFTPLSVFEEKNIFIWKGVDLPDITTNKLRFVVEIPGGTLNEIAIYSRKDTEPVQIQSVLAQNTLPADKGSVQNLFDEQSKAISVPTYMDGMYFDEIYHARTAFEFLHRLEPYEISHPPLGKILISIGIAIFGMVPFGWRIVGTLFGAAMIPLMYVFGKRMFKNKFYAFCCAYLMMFDFMHFTQTRIATIDVYVVFFIILMYYFMYLYFSNKSYEIGVKNSTRLLFYSILFFGLGAASKWIAIYGFAGLIIIFLISRYEEYMDYSKIINSSEKKPEWTKKFMADNIYTTFAYFALFLGVVPIAIYVLSYIPFILVPNGGHGINIFIENSVYMYKYHSELVATHPYQSKWWEWPLIVRPMCFYTLRNLPGNKVSTIVTMGNPAVWWVGSFITLAYSVLVFFKRFKTKEVIFLLIAIFFQYIPWIIISRIAFIYHFFSVIPFIILLIVYAIKSLVNKYPRLIYLVYLYLAIVVFLFIMFYPVLSGMEMSMSYKNLLEWGSHWIF